VEEGRLSKRAAVAAAVVSTRSANSGGLAWQRLSPPLSLSVLFNEVWRRPARATVGRAAVAAAVATDAIKRWVEPHTMPGCDWRLRGAVGSGCLRPPQLLKGGIRLLRQPHWGVLWPKDALKRRQYSIEGAHAGGGGGGGGSGGSGGSGKTSIKAGYTYYSYGSTLL